MAVLIRKEREESDFVGQPAQESAVGIRTLNR
jgi:hypothetical protein